MRLWVKWTIALVWAATAMAVVVLDRTHISATATVTVHVREVSFTTDSPTMFDATNQDRLSVSGPADMTLSVIPDEKSHGTYTKSIVVHAPSTASSCTFYNVRTGPLSLPQQTGIVLLWPKNADPHSYSVRLRGQVAGDIYEAGSDSAPSSYLCTTVDSSASLSSGNLGGRLSNAFATTFGTHGDAQLSYRVRSNEIPGESQVHVSGPLSIAHTDPADPGQEKGVILNPISSDSKNQIVFDDISRTVLLNPNDLVLIQPGADLYIRRFIVDHGIQLDIHGTVRDIRVGAGSKNLRSCMPSIFDTLDNKKRIYGAIPGIVAFILGLFEAVGLLPRKSK